jgi:hypothetical protein
MDKELVEQITVLATETALKVLADEKKQIADRRLRNTKLLLKNYRMLTIHSKNTVLKINELNQLLTLDLTETGEIEIESIKKSKQKTLLMLNFIDRMLETYRVINEKRFVIVCCLYIAEEKTSVEELARYYNCTTRAIYKELNNAVSEISALLFGISSILD